MTNYEVTPVRMPTKRQEVEQFERWLEDISRRGGELVTIMPSPSTSHVIAIFRVAKKGTVPKEDMK